MTAEPTSDSPLLAVARSRLARVLRADMVDETLRRAMAEAGLTTVSTADELFRLGQALAKQPGFTGVAGESLKVLAQIRGATTS